LRRARIDENQPTIIKAFRDLGCSVQPLHTVGKGCPDLLVGLPSIYGFGIGMARTILVEIKNPSKPKSDRQKTKDQIKWWDSWRGGNLYQVETVEDVLKICGMNQYPRMHGAESL